MVTIISSIDAGQNFQPLQMTKHTLWLVIHFLNYSTGMQYYLMKTNTNC